MCHSISIFLRNMTGQEVRVLCATLVVDTIMEPSWFQLMPPVCEEASPSADHSQPWVNLVALTPCMGVVEGSSPWESGHCW
jgi:predicted transcriptional regulator YheO